jgi:hypothetical protein
MAAACASCTTPHALALTCLALVCACSQQNGATVSQFLKQYTEGPPRPNAVILGTELNDIALGNGLTGVDSTITVG